MHGDVWEWVRCRPHITVVWSDDLDEDEVGRAEFATNTILLAKDLTQAERRTACWHEVRHLERGAPPAYHEAREERAVDLEVARDLIPLDALVDAMLWSADDWEIAEELTVSVDLVRVRLHNLS